MPNINARVHALECRLGAPATSDEELAAEIVRWCTDHELDTIIDVLEAAPEDQEEITDSRVLEILHTAYTRREQYGSVEAWQKAQRTD